MEISSFFLCAAVFFFPSFFPSLKQASLEATPGALWAAQCCAGWFNDWSQQRGWGEAGAWEVLQVDARIVFPARSPSVPLIVSCLSSSEEKNERLPPDGWWSTPECIILLNSLPQASLPLSNRKILHTYIISASLLCLAFLSASLSLALSISPHLF